MQKIISLYKLDYEGTRLVFDEVVGGAELLPDAPRDFARLRSYFTEHDIEGIVWHHPDGRMVKIKGKDFGIKRRTKVAA